MLVAEEATIVLPTKTPFAFMKDDEKERLQKFQSGCGKLGTHSRALLPETLIVDK